MISWSDLEQWHFIGLGLILHHQIALISDYLQVQHRQIKSDQVIEISQIN